MDKVESYVAVIDAGSSRILGCTGYVDPMGKLHILASERVDMDTEIRRGLIQNVKEVGAHIRSVLDKLETNPQYPCQIGKVYVGINAYTMYSLNASSITHLNGTEVIDDVLLDGMWEDAEEKNKPENKDVLYHFVQKYVVDGFQSMDPRGERPSDLEASYKIVVGKPLIMKNMEEAFEIADAEDAFRHILGIIASSEAVLSPEEKGKGVVVIDFGADTTTICIYKDNVVRHISVLPFGGRNITTDLKQLNMEFEEAEKQKLAKGSALYYTELMAENASEKEPSEEDKCFNEIVVARVEEIVENIWAQIQYSGVSTAMLASGIVVTGGASQLNGLKKLLSRKTNLPVRDGDVSRHLSDDTDDQYNSPVYAQCIGLMLLAEAGCKALDVEVEAPVEMPAEAPVEAKDQALFEEEEIPAAKEAKQKTKRGTQKSDKSQSTSIKDKLGWLFTNLEESMSDDN